ncbi:hypothetical protein [Candidatus Ichthyocystis hellenicum]|uniref:hypothetical protein n=1 Tax=Candidatus Ichthyocystis hellenicum TaxID=1561003 RepID=UPI000B89121B|nr:hypothetical protein [Candidatus Ichthyocystis hellenicum]
MKALTVAINLAVVPSGSKELGSEKCSNTETDLRGFFSSEEKNCFLIDIDKNGVNSSSTPIPVTNIASKKFPGNIAVGIERGEDLDVFLTSAVSFMVITAIFLIALSVFFVAHTAFTEGIFALSNTPAVKWFLLGGCGLLASGLTLCLFHK